MAGVALVQVCVPACEHDCVLGGKGEQFDQSRYMWQVWHWCWWVPAPCARLCMLRGLEPLHMAGAGRPEWLKLISFLKPEVAPPEEDRCLLLKRCSCLLALCA